MIKSTSFALSFILVLLSLSLNLSSLIGAIKLRDSSEADTLSLIFRVVSQSYIPLSCTYSTLSLIASDEIVKAPLIT